FRLHPLAPALRLGITAGGLCLEGHTLDLGGGYAAYARRVGRALFAALGATPPPLEAPDALACLGARARAPEGPPRPQPIGAFGVPRYPEVALATPLGPRDEAWRAAVAARPEAGLDALPWATEGLGAAHRLGRALSLIWHEVRFRES